MVPGQQGAEEMGVDHVTPALHQSRSSPRCGSIVAVLVGNAAPYWKSVCPSVCYAAVVVGSMVRAS
jgi:hypothetical protein